MKKLSPFLQMLFLPLMCFIIFGACDNNRPSKNKELQRSLRQLTSDFPEYYDIISFNEAVVEDDAIVIYSQIDPSFYVTQQKSGLKALWEDEVWKEDFKETMINRHSHLIKLAQSAGIDICWRFIDPVPNSAVKSHNFDIRLSDADVKSLQKQIAENKKHAEAAVEKLKAITTDLNAPLPQEMGNGLKLMAIEAQPNDLVYLYEVDESVSSIKKMEDRLVLLGKSKMNDIFENGIAKDSLLLTVADADMGLLYKFKGSKTGFTLDYRVMTPKDFRELRIPILKDKE